VKHRATIPAPERVARSKLAQIVHDRPFLQASLVTMKHTCGKPACRCARGDKHVSLYLATRLEGKRKMIYVPKSLEDMVRTWVRTYQESGKLSQRISAECMKKFLKEKSKICSSRSGESPQSVRTSARAKTRASKASGKTSKKTTRRRAKS
jgi:hypothetical protein